MPKHLMLSVAFGALIAFGLMAGSAQAQSHSSFMNTNLNTNFGSTNMQGGTAGYSSGAIDGGGMSRPGQWSTSNAQSGATGGATTYTSPGLSSTSTWSNQFGGGSSSGNAGYDFGAGSTAAGGSTTNTYSGYSGFNAFSSFSGFGN